ncbi:MAG TPA: TetR/AcrR family transcriptional regulator [Solirubrobacteraceae bacterium]|nr:TetR/AcrR family transcriptional regulator [Solirubrobacteraceae bacterium]
MAAENAGRGRQGLPRGPQALPREQVAAHQRRRLHLAMVECVDEHGYAATTISQLVARARISRRSFYERYRNKDECLIGTYDEIVERLGLRLVAALGRAETWSERLEAYLKTLFDAAADRPDAARLVCVEMGAAGPAGVQRWADGAERLRRFISDGFAGAPGPGTVPDPVALAIVGAIRRILYTRLQGPHTNRGLRADLSRLVPDLMAWIDSYYPSPPGLSLSLSERTRALAAGASARVLGTDDDSGGRPGPAPQRLGGRAPGTLSARSLSGERGLPRGEHNLPRGFVEHNQRERIFDAIANLTAADGYPALSLDEVAAEAAISLQTFYKHFSSKEEAFTATYEAGHARAMAVVNQTLAKQSSWVGAVRAGAAALLELLACEPAYAHLACVDVMIAYPHMAKRANVANHFYAGLLDLRIVPDAPADGPTPVAGEAIVGGVFELLHDYVLHGRTSELPQLGEYVAYIALAPFMGATEAWAAIS